MIIVYNRDSKHWQMTHFIDIGEAASQNVADLLTTNSKASYEIFHFQDGPHLILDSITRTALSAPISFCYQWKATMTDAYPDMWQIGNNISIVNAAILISKHNMQNVLDNFLFLC